VLTTPRLVLAGLAALLTLAVGSEAPASTQSGPKPWHLSSASQFRLPAPPAASSVTTRAELRELLRLQKRRSPAMRAAITRWNGRSAVIPWTEAALRMIVDHRPRPPFSARALATLETGMYDALLAAKDSRAAYAKQARPSPAVLEPRLQPLLRVAGSTYAPPEAAIAGAAERILAYLFPNEPVRTFRALADEAVNSRLWAGANYRSDVTRARALGQRVAGQVLERAKVDGSTNTGFSHPALSGEAYWSPTPPAYEPPIGGPVGTWRPWLMSSPGQLRNVIPGPSAYGSQKFLDQLLEVLSVSETLTTEQRQTAFFWDDGPGTFTPAGHWFEIAIDLAKAFKAGKEQTARVFAYLGAVEGDAAIAFFEAKYYWWSIRPLTAMWRLCDSNSRLCTEPEVAANPARAPLRDVWFPIIATPAFPAYPGGHSTFSGGAGRLLTYFFPAAGQELNKLAQEAADSRLYGGIHFDEDNDAGLVLGRAIADLAIARASAER